MHVPATGGGEGAPLLANAAPLAVLVAMPLGMALATGVEAPADAIAQLGQLRDRGRRMFGQLTVWIMVAIVGVLTIWIAVLAVRLGIGVPGENSTLLAEVARRATGGGALFGGFQAASALLLIAASASAYVACSGLLRALAMHAGEGRDGLVPARFAVTNRYLVPGWGVLATFIAAAAIILPAGADEQVIVKFYAVAVFVSFLAALIGAARLSHREGNRAALAVNVLGTVLVAFVLALNLTRLDALVALAATVILGMYLRVAWIRRGRPSGVSEATQAAEDG